MYTKKKIYIHRLFSFITINDVCYRHIKKSEFFIYQYVYLVAYPKRDFKDSISLFKFIFVNELQYFEEKIKLH